MTITKSEADAIFRLARALEDTGRICSLSASEDRMEWRTKNQEVQCALQDMLKQLQEPDAISSMREYYELYQVRRHGFDALLLGTFQTVEQGQKAADVWREEIPRDSFRLELVTREIVATWAAIAKGRHDLAND